MLRFIVMNCGYVESATTSSIIYGSDYLRKATFSSYKAAITELALDLYAKYYEEYLSIYQHRYDKDVKECCRESLIRDSRFNKETKFCAECKEEIKDKPFDAEEFANYIVNLHQTTCDLYGDCEWANGRDLVWWPWAVRDLIGAPKEDVIFIAENAEGVLLAALLEVKPELNTDPNYHPENDHDWKKFRAEIQPSYY